ncbi:hypothetical protein Gogos_015829 [Gossypium gossypioides]|uniref:Uncharacterized protein n=1 Tax=Gossypium gossypioides TaxID=34282 RepID=A0A7J9C2W1_GOSGO|nr:hypothetical protein [Gossypium gossypioides]
MSLLVRFDGLNPLFPTPLKIRLLQVRRASSVY